jgi:hypothetical protein
VEELYDAVFAKLASVGEVRACALYAVAIARSLPLTINSVQFGTAEELRQREDIDIKHRVQMYHKNSVC